MQECKESLKVVRYPKNDVFNRKLDLRCGDFDGDTISHELDQLIKENTEKLTEQMLKFGKYAVYCSDSNTIDSVGAFTIDIVKTNDGHIFHYNFN